MNENQSISRRFLADFIAARLPARRGDANAPRPTRGDSCPGTSPVIEGDPAEPSNRKDSRPGERPRADGAAHLLPRLGSTN
jgi:hypothetical protein